MKKFRLIHYNDVYNIDVSKSEPIGGASRFVAAVKDEIKNANCATCLTTFGGDIFSPSPLNPLTKGAEMPPIMSFVNTTVACVGNHELDNGIKIMRERIAETNFPWVLSNLYETSTGTPIGGVQRYAIIEKCEVKFGFFGLGSKDWVENIKAVELKDYSFVAPLECADRVSEELREQGCDVIVCLTHMSQPDDIKVVTAAKDIDILLGGHDHIIWTKKYDNGRWAIKAGSDFKTFGRIDFTISEDKKEIQFEEPVIRQITSDQVADEEAEKFVQEALKPLKDPALNKELVMVNTTLDGRFFSIRTQETGLGNLVTDALALQTGTPNAIYNSGTFRADNIDPPSPWTHSELVSVLPFNSTICVVKVSGEQLLKRLEFGTAKYPVLSGDFVQVSGIKFMFDAKKPPGSRIDSQTATATDDSGEIIPILTQGAQFTIVTNTYSFQQACQEGIFLERQLVRNEKLSGPELVAAYMKSIETDTDNDGVNELGVISPKAEGRIVCLNPDPNLVKKYPY